MMFTALHQIDNILTCCRIIYTYPVCLHIFTGNPDLRDGFYVRYKIWKSPGTMCHGKWVDFICVLGAGDLHKAVISKQFFLNKLNLDMDPIAYQCLEQWYNDRVQKGRNPDFDIGFYMSRKLVNNHI